MTSICVRVGKRCRTSWLSPSHRINSAPCQLALKRAYSSDDSSGGKGKGKPLRNSPSRGIPNLGITDAFDMDDEEKPQRKGKYVRRDKQGGTRDNRGGNRDGKRMHNNRNQNRNNWSKLTKAEKEAMLNKGKLYPPVPEWTLPDIFQEKPEIEYKPASEIDQTLLEALQKGPPGFDATLEELEKKYSERTSKKKPKKAEVAEDSKEGITEEEINEATEDDEEKPLVNIETLQPRVWTQKEIELYASMGDDESAIYGIKKLKKMKDEKLDANKSLLEQQALSLQDVKPESLITTAPITLRERLKQYDTIKDYNSYLQFLHKIGGTAALSEEAFYAEKDKWLKKIFHLHYYPDYDEQSGEENPFGLDEPLAVLEDNIRDPFEDLMTWRSADTLGEPLKFEGPREECWPDDPARVDGFLIKKWRTTNMKRGGRRHKLNCLMLVGNRNGAAGFAVGKALEYGAAREKAYERAVKYMTYFDRRDNRTIYENVHVKLVSTNVYLQFAPIDHGIVAHKHIREICLLAGIKDLIANVKGSMNTLNIVRGTFMALQKQNNPATRLNNTPLTLLEYSAENAMPILKRKGCLEDCDFRDVESAVRQRLALSKKQIKEMTEDWMFEFPLRPTPQNFETARLVRHGLLLEEHLKMCKDPVPEALREANELNASKLPEMVAWLKTAPNLVDPSFGVMYPHEAESVYNCRDFYEFDYDDDCVLYYEDVKDTLNNVVAAVSFQ
eukprot:m.117704 g.117704  ORF g.117704 m.117704 type:complete len:727 (+) comp14257_c0_seq2:112-2292(+)